MRWTVFAGVVVAVWSANVATAEANDTSTTAETETAAVPVFEGGVKRPYIVVGQIVDNLRKPFAFMANPTQEKIYAEIWERAKKMGADAVINARFGETKRTLFNHGSTPISGTAIKYISEGKPGN